MTELNTLSPDPCLATAFTICYILGLFCLEDNWKLEKKFFFDKFLNPVIANNQNVLMAFGVMAYTNGDLV